MEIIIPNEAVYEKDLSAVKLTSFLTSQFNDRKNSRCYYTHPKYPTYNPFFVPTTIIIDKKGGVIAFKTFDCSPESLEDPKILEKLQEEISDFEEYIHLFFGDITNPKYKLHLNLKSYLYFPFLENQEDLPDFLNEISLEEVTFGEPNQFENLFSTEMEELSEEGWRRLVSIIQNVESLSKDKYEKITEPITNLRDAIIYNNKKICNFDDEQELAVIKEIDGGMQIRGLAGTGKTIVLAWKAAYLHSKYPDKKILFTFYTRSLYIQIRRLINKFFLKYSKGKTPNWENLNVLHAWGGRGKEGVYYNACVENGYIPLAYGPLRLLKAPFDEACKKLMLSKDKKLEEIYDFILVDEAQDMPPSFFNLLEEISVLPKRIIIAYDDLQTLEDINMLEFKELLPNTPLKKDIILKKSYRNHIDVLHTALSLGLGIHNKSGLVQIIDRESNWNAIGYTLNKGEFKEGETIELERPKENNPNDVTEIYPKIKPLNFEKYPTREEEIIEVSKKINDLILNEKVKPEDILVISLDHKNLRKDFANLEIELLKKGIGVKIPGLSDEAEDFLIEGNITLSTGRRAKGNEAPIVFVMGMDILHEPSDKVTDRLNRSLAFVSLTRSKGWCFISGAGENAESLKLEIEQIKEDI
jgi:superfamily I DNA and RNA helicase